MLLLMQQATEKVVSNPTVTALASWVALGFLALLGIAILYLVFTGKIDLSQLISEPSGEASMSRFQLLIFTFVTAACLFLIVASNYPLKFPDIPQGVLVLLGISSSSYLVSKGIQASSKEGLGGSGPTLTIAGSAPTTSLGGPPIDFQATISGVSDETIKWSLDPPTGRGTIEPKSGDPKSAIFTPPPSTPATIADAKGKKVVIQAVSKENLALKDTATIELT
jgi:hypothetical protein